MKQTIHYPPIAENDVSETIHAIVGLQPALRRYAMYLCRDRVGADDLVQDTIVKALDKIHLWETSTNLKAWMMVIMRNLFINGRRLSTRHSLVAIDDLTQQLAVAGIQDVQLELAEVFEAFKRLRSDHQDMLAVLCEEPAYAELAERFCIPLGTVRSRAHRARRALRSEIERGIFAS